MAMDTIRKAQQARSELIRRGELRQLDPLTKSRNNPKSRLMAINAMCYACQGGEVDNPPDSGWQWSIGNCSITFCPLFDFRPYRHKVGQPAEGAYR